MSKNEERASLDDGPERKPAEKEKNKKGKEKGSNKGAHKMRLIPAGKDQQGGVWMRESPSRIRVKKTRIVKKKVRKKRRVRVRKSYSKE